MTDQRRQPGSVEVRENIAASCKGRKLTDDHKAKLSQARSGKPLSPEQVSAISASMTGRPYAPERLEAARARYASARLKDGYGVTDTWPAEDIARLREMWANGDSTKTIGDALRRNKNAVIGKVHRLGLPRRPSPINRLPKDAPRAPRVRAPVPRRAVKPAPTPKPVMVRVPYVPVVSVGMTQCQFPFGHPGQPGFRFCGATPVVLGRSYCIACHRVAYQVRTVLVADAA